MTETVAPVSGHAWTSKSLPVRGSASHKGSVGVSWLGPLTLAFAALTLALATPGSLTVIGVAATSAFRIASATSRVGISHATSTSVSGAGEMAGC